MTERRQRHLSAYAHAGQVRGADTSRMEIAFVALGLVLVVVAVGRLRTSSTGIRWPYGTSAMLAGLMVALSGGGVLVALTVGRTTWNAWTAGTAQRENVTMNMLFLGVPLLLALAVLFLFVGSLSDGRLRRRRATSRTAAGAERNADSAGQRI
jgi:hypothetical protein